MNTVNLSACILLSECPSVRRVPKPMSAVKTKPNTMTWVSKDRKEISVVRLIRFTNPESPKDTGIQKKREMQHPKHGICS